MRQKYMKTKILDLFTSWDNDTLILQTGNGNFNTWHNDTLNLDIRQRRHIMSQKYMKTRILDIFKSWHNDTLVLEKRHRRHVMRQKYIKATILHFSIDDTMTHILEKWQRYIGKFDLINDTMWQWFWKKYTPDFCTCFVILACMRSPFGAEENCFSSMKSSSGPVLKLIKVLLESLRPMGIRLWPRI